MEASVTIDGFTAFNSTRYRVPLDKVFFVKLTGAPHRMRWFADEDQVLKINEAPDGLSAEITATAAGKSDIQLQGRGPHLDLLIHVQVYSPEATRFKVPEGVNEPL